ncbi:unnamed protein product, partial [Ectocarpus sp. 4 AP-2014]
MGNQLEYPSVPDDSPAFRLVLQGDRHYTGNHHHSVTFPRTGRSLPCFHVHTFLVTFTYCTPLRPPSNHIFPTRITRFPACLFAAKIFRNIGDREEADSHSTSVQIKQPPLCLPHLRERNTS